MVFFETKTRHRNSFQHHNYYDINLKKARLDDLYSLVDSEEKESSKVNDAISEVLILFNKEVNWRKDASKNLMPELEKYNSVIKDNIGLRLQSRLTKDQAKFVAACNSIHRDISLNF